MIDTPTDRRSASGGATVGVCIGLAVLTVTASVIAAAVDRNSSSDYVNEIVSGVANSVTAVVGATIALARPRNVVGWLILASGTLAAVAEALVESGVHGVLHPGSVGGAAYLATFGVVCRSIPSVITTAAVPAFFPDGRLPGRRWRWIGWFLAAAVVLTIVGGLLAPIETRLGERWHGPFTPAGSLGDNLQGIDLLAALATVVAAVGALAGLVSRWRRGNQIVRQQLLLFACAVAVALVFLAGVLFVVIAFNTNQGAPRYVFALAALPLPVAVAIATLNSGLYDLRRAANRTILWLLVSSSIAALYVVVVVLAATLSPDRSAWWPPALAAGVAAVALVPLRDRLQHVVHRLVYGRWREPYEVLSELAAQLEAVNDVDRLLDAAVGRLGAELDLHDVSVRDSSGAVLAGASERADESVPLSAYGVTVGELRFRTSDRQLSESETRLIRDLAVHLGGTLHARLLLDDLQRTRERLVLAREEERRRLRRDLHDGIGPALAGLTLKAETTRALLAIDADAARRQLSELSEEIRATVVDVRRVVEGLRPPALDELGLDDACRQAVDRLTRAAGISAEVVSDPAVASLPAAVEVAAFRIVTEAVTNVVRHARAQRCSVSLVRDPTALVVTVCDDGTGLASNSDAGHGLATMRERAEELGGSLSIVPTEPGLRVTAVLPAPRSGAAA